MKRSSRALAACITAWSLSAGAAPCGRADVDATFPAADAVAIPRNAVLSAHLAAPAVYDDEPVTLLNEAGESVELQAQYDEALSLLVATPSAPLGPGRHHLAWPGLRGRASGLGLGRELTFTVSELDDEAAPKFAGLVGIDWDLSRERDPCLDRLDDRFVFRLAVGAASDDAGTEPLALLVFQTRDPTSPDRTEPVQVALRPFPADAVVEVRRPATSAGTTCFASVVRDLVGSISGGGERQVCVTTSRPPFFDGCATHPSSSNTFTFTASALLGLLALRRGRSATRRD